MLAEFIPSTTVDSATASREKVTRTAFENNKLS
jgi:hypothetical protein